MNGADDRHTIAADGLSASVLAQGAELCSLHDSEAGEMLWQAGPAWPRHAPVLFPIVGRLRDDRLIDGDGEYRMTQHGFARDRRFTFARRDPHACRLELQDDVETRDMYPYPFRLSLDFSIASAVLTVAYTALNTGDETMPVNLGAHPALRWPLASGVAKDRHILTFEHPEPAPMPRIIGGLLGPATNPSLIHGRVLKLNEAIFAHDALVLPALNSRWVRFTAPGAPGIEMRWHGFGDFGIWTRQPGDFLCLEPWCGMASPADWQGPFADKPGIIRLAPGQSLEASYSLAVLPRQDVP